MTKKRKKVSGVEVKNERHINYEAIKPISERANLAEILTVRFTAEAAISLTGMIVRELFQRIGIRGRIVQLDDVMCVVQVDFDYHALKNKEGDEVASVQGSFLVVYLSDGKWKWQDADSELVEQFGELNGVFNTWSYVRELVASSLTRLGLTGVLLPLWRPPATLPPKGEFAILKYSPGDKTEKPDEK